MIDSRVCPVEDRRDEEGEQGEEKMQLARREDTRGENGEDKPVAVLWTISGTIRGRE